jgi:broad specificity phosphatase PhoE
MRNFYLIRHGETDWNVKFKKLQGHSDIPLNEKGRRQAAKLRDLVAPLCITKVISSDLLRAQETAQFLNSQFETTTALREVHLGIGEGLTWDEVEERLGFEFRQKWAQNHQSSLDLRFPGGESRKEVLARVQSCLLQNLLAHPQETIAFVCHGYVIRSLVYSFTEIHENWFVPNCAVIPFEFAAGQISYVGPHSIDELLQPHVDENLENR